MYIFCFLLPFCPVFEGFLGFIIYIIDSVFDYACFIILLTVWIFLALSPNFQDIFLSWSLLFNICSWSPLTPLLCRSSGSRSQDYFCRAWTWRTRGRQWGLFNVWDRVCMEREGLWAQRYQLKLGSEHWPVVLTPTVPESPLWMGKTLPTLQACSQDGRAPLGPWICTFTVNESSSISPTPLHQSGKLPFVILHPRVVWLLDYIYVWIYFSHFWAASHAYSNPSS